MPRPRTPTAVLELKGSFKKDPQRRRDGEPVVKGPIGNAPDHFNEDELIVWKEVTETAPRGVLTEADRLTVEALCSLYAAFRADRFEFPIAKIARIQNMLGTLGMNPADRSKLSVPPEKPTNEFDDL